MFIKDKQDQSASLPLKKDSFVAMETRCPICSSILNIRRKDIHGRAMGMVHEEAFCPHCQIVVRSQKHKLH